MAIIDKFKKEVEELEEQHVPTMEEIDEENKSLEKKEIKAVEKVIGKKPQEVPKKGGSHNGCKEKSC